MAGLGEMLRAARQDMGVSLAEVEQATKIRRRYLVALEDEDFLALPETIYVVGILRTYAQYLGLDPEQTTDEFRRQSGRRDMPGVQPETRLLREASRRSGISPAGVSGVLVIAGLVLLLFFGYQQYVELQKAVGPPSVPTPVPSTPTVGPTATSAVLFPSPTDTPAPTATPTIPQGVTVELKIVQQQCWIRAIVDDQIVTKNGQNGEMLNPGETRTFTGKEFVFLRVGNAGAADITYNGIREGTMGPLGAVREKEWRSQAAP